MLLRIFIQNMQNNSSREFFKNTFFCENHKPFYLYPVNLDVKPKN